MRTVTSAAVRHADEEVSRAPAADLSSFDGSGGRGVEDFRTAMPDEYAAVMAMISLAEGKPAIHVGARDGSVFVCRRVSGLRVDPGMWTLWGECDWVDPPEHRPEELTDGMWVSCGDCLELGPGWWLDRYFGWYMVYDPALVARSLAGDHTWVPEFLATASRRKAEPGAADEVAG